MGHLSTLETTARVASVERGCLLTRLRDHAEVPVVFVHAPAGFGKTTLAEQWARHDPRPHSTVRIALPYDDPDALALELIDALESIGPDTGQIRSVATGTEPGFSALLLPTITRLASSRRYPYVLVLDDVQLLRNPACHGLLGAVVRGLPKGSQLALLSRQDPPPWLARTHAEGRLLCLGAFDQIGEHLFLSRATIKSHAAAIFRKLGASSRDEAVARARSLGLVESPPAD